jgi:hypothetical protein
MYIVIYDNIIVFTSRALLAARIFSGEITLDGAQS